MKLTVKKAYIFIINILLFVILHREGMLKYLFALGVMGVSLVCRNMRIKRSEKIYFFLPWLFYILVGWGCGIAQKNINAYSFKQTIFYLIPLLLSFMVSACIKNNWDAWITMQFWAIIGVFLVMGILYWGQGDLMESQYAFIFGAYILYFVWNRKYFFGALAAAGLYLATKRIAIIATILVLCFLLFLRVVKSAEMKRRILRLSSILALGVPFIYIYIIRSGILEKLVYRYDIQTMGRLNIYTMMSEHYFLGLSYLGKGIGSTRAIVEGFGFESYQLLHNDILSFYIELGFLGFLIFWIIYIAIFWRLINKIDIDKMIILLALFIYTVIVFMTDNISIYMNYFYPFYMMLFSLMDKEKVLEEKKIGKKRFFDVSV